MESEKRLFDPDMKIIDKYFNKRLIDANALMDSHWWESLRDDFDKARAKIIVMSAPTVDAVEVVRCKDCKKWKCHGLQFDITRGTCYNPKFHLHYGHVLEECFMPVTNETDFCSYGERKDNA